MGELTAIWVKRARGLPMEARSEVRAVAGSGLEGNFPQGGHRQVTVISAEAWQRVEEELGGVADPALRRANLLVSGIELQGARGRVLRVGPSRILVHGETRPCRLMDELRPGLQAALDPEWRGGIYGEVLTGGVIAVDDAAAWEPAAAGEPAAPMQ